MMKRLVTIGVVMIVLFAGKGTQAGAGEIINGSFEDDGWISDVESRDPNGWGVDMSPVKFGGYVYTDWATDGTFSLALFSKWATFSPGDMATVYQDVNLANVKQIEFDLKLETEFAFDQWDPNVSAVLLIDGEVVWDSSKAGLVAKGEYLGLIYAVEEKYRGGGLHKLSLGIRLNIDGRLWSTYITQWDAVDCNLFCGGAGPIEGDIDGNCCVDGNDLSALASVWLSDGVAPDDRANLSHVDDDPNGSGGIISFLDFALYAAGWDGSSMAGVEEIAANWLMPVDLGYEYNLFDGDDTLASGIVNFFDFEVLAEKWLECSSVQEP